MALTYATGAVLCTAAVLLPGSPGAPVRLLTALAVLDAAVAVLLWVAPDRVATRSVHAAAAGVALLVALAASGSASAVGVVGQGPIVITMAVYAAHFWTPGVARVHVALLVVVTTAGAALSPAAGWERGWITAVVTAVGLAEVHMRVGGRRLHRAATTDPLTGLLNRRAWREGATRSLARESRAGTPFTVAVLDLDHFKAVNDGQGHAAGDALLRALAGSWLVHLRTADLLGRYGGDEFVLGLPGASAADAEVLLARLAASHPARWSVGTATTAADEDLDALLARADDELYRRKSERTVDLPR